MELLSLGESDAPSQCIPTSGIAVGAQMLVEDVELKLIDSKRNCFRVYAISATLSLFGEQCLVIRWGRIGRVRTRTEVFDTLAACEARYTELLQRRRRHGYVVVCRPGAGAANCAEAERANSIAESE